MFIMILSICYATNENLNHENNFNQEKKLSQFQMLLKQRCATLTDSNVKHEKTLSKFQKLLKQYEGIKKDIPKIPLENATSISSPAINKIYDNKIKTMANVYKTNKSFPEERTRNRPYPLINALMNKNIRKNKITIKQQNVILPRSLDPLDVPTEKMWNRSIKITNVVFHQK